MVKQKPNAMQLAVFGKLSLNPAHLIQPVGMVNA